MSFEDNRVSPKMCRSTVQSGEDPVLRIGETPLRLVTRVGVSVWCDDVDTGCSAEAVCDVGAGVLVAWRC